MVHMTTTTETHETVLILKTVGADMTAYGGFRWPESGPVTAPDWDPRPVCGRGLHGLLWGCGAPIYLSTLSSAKWVVYEADPADVVDLGGMVKARAGSVVYCGDRDGAIAYLDAHGAAGMPVLFAHRSTGDHGTARCGFHGTATAGDFGTATAGYRGTAVAGDYGTATAGYRGTATAGIGGCIQITWWEGSRRRDTTGYVGRGGIEAGVAYRCDREGRLVPA